MNKNRNTTSGWITFIFPACLGLGTGFGALIHNVGAGLAVGAGIGVALQLIADWLGNHPSGSAS